MQTCNSSGAPPEKATKATRPVFASRVLLRGCLWAFLASVTAFVGMWGAYLPASVYLISLDMIPDIERAATARELAMLFFIITPLAAPFLGLVFGLIGAFIASRLEQHWKRALHFDPSGNIGRTLGALFAGALAGALLTVIIMGLLGRDMSSPIASASRNGMSQYDRGNYDQAIEYFSKAVELDPRSTRSYYNRGLAYYQKGDLDRAVQDCTRALELDPRNSSAYYWRGNAYMKKGLKEQATADLQTYLKLVPDSPYRAQVEQWIRELE